MLGFLFGRRSRKRANKFKPCVLCGSKRFAVTGMSRLAVRHQTYFVTQPFVCLGCNMGHILARTTDSDTWAPRGEVG